MFNNNFSPDKGKGNAFMICPRLFKYFKYQIIANSSDYLTVADHMENPTNFLERNYPEFWNLFKDARVKGTNLKRQKRKHHWPEIRILLKAKTCYFN